MDMSPGVDFLPFGLYSTPIFVLAIVAATLTFSTTIVKIWVSRARRLHFFFSDYLAVASSATLLASLGLIIYSLMLGRNMSLLKRERWGWEKERKAVSMSGRPKQAYMGLCISINSNVSLPVQLYGEPSTPYPDPTDRSTFLKAAFAIEVLWPTSLTLSKLSILLLYRRVFFSMRLRIGVVCTMIFIVLLFIAVFWGTIFQCSPVQSFWHGPSGDEEPSCFNRQLFFLFSDVPNIIANAVILTLPIYELAKLRTRWGVKVYLWAIFLLGSTALGASIARFVEIARIDGAGSKEFRVGGGASVIVEATAATLCAYLPTLCPALWKSRPPRSRSRRSSNHPILPRWPRPGLPSKRHFLENYDTPSSRFTGARKWPRSRPREDRLAKPLPDEPPNEWLQSLGSLSTIRESTVRESTSLIGGIIVEETVTTTVERRSRLFDPQTGRMIETSFGPKVGGPGAIV